MFNCAHSCSFFKEVHEMSQIMQRIKNCQQTRIINKLIRLFVAYFCLLNRFDFVKYAKIAYRQRTLLKSKEKAHFVIYYYFYSRNSAIII